MHTSVPSHEPSEFCLSEGVARNAGRMWISRSYAEPLRKAGLDRFESVMTTRAGRLLRTIADRENRRLELEGGHGGPQGVYLKRHRERSWIRRLLARLGLGRGRTPGVVEADNVRQLEAAGIAAMRLVAFGERLRTDGISESFVLTEELTGFAQLDFFLRERFAAGNQLAVLPAASAGRDRDLDRLAADVAAVAARFHEQGFNHRDFYCCHFFIREVSRGGFEVRLIDLQRVQRRRWFRRRWIVKDLAQLAYSAPRERVSRPRKLAFMKHYLGVKKLRPADKRLIRRVLAKQRAMEYRLGAHP